MKLLLNSWRLLVLVGAPVITKLDKGRANGGKLLSCKAEGLPKPTVQWSINGTNVSMKPRNSSYIKYFKSRSVIHSQYWVIMIKSYEYH